jgi:hypothetical protein
LVSHKLRRTRSNSILLDNNQLVHAFKKPNFNNAVRQALPIKLAVVVEELNESVSNIA